MREPTQGVQPGTFLPEDAKCVGGKSGGGPPQSKTLPRGHGNRHIWNLLTATKVAKRRGVRQPSGAFGRNDGKHTPVCGDSFLKSETKNWSELRFSGGWTFGE